MFHATRYQGTCQPGRRVQCSSQGCLSPIPGTSNGFQSAKTLRPNYEGLATTRRTLLAAISRNAITISRLSDDTRGLAPFRSCFARTDATCTRSKRLETLSKQSSTVILAMRDSRLRRATRQGQFCGASDAGATCADNRQCSRGVERREQGRFIFRRHRSRPAQYTSEPRHSPEIRLRPVE